ncbi:MAG: VOC family protein [Planctomycetes bacterium]|nr:VOC family protein [Planctomycetota bacterium]
MTQPDPTATPPPSPTLHIAILFTADPARSRAFYGELLGLRLALDAGVYFEFEFGGAHARLGLLARRGLPGIIGETGARPWNDGAPRAEVYLRYERVAEVIARLEAARAPALSALADRDWGDRAAYFADPDGHVVAVAEPLRQ